MRNGEIYQSDMLRLLLAVVLVTESAGLAAPALNSAVLRRSHIGRPCTHHVQRSRLASVRAAADVASAPPAMLGGALSLGGIVAADVLLKRIFVARAISFPASLAGSVMVFGGLCSLRAARPALAESVFDAAKPGCGIIAKWLPIFFVPNLVLLPLVLKLGAAEAARLALLIVVGALLALPLSAYAALALSGAAAPAAPAATPAPAPTPAPKPFPAPLLRNLAAASALCAAVSTAAFRTGYAHAGLPGYAFMLLATATGFVGGATLVPKPLQKVLHPLISCTLFTHAAIAAYTAAAGISYRAVVRSYLVPGGAAYAAPGNLLLAMLGPATLSFGFSMYETRHQPLALSPTTYPSPPPLFLSSYKKGRPPSSPTNYLPLLELITSSLTTNFVSD